MIKFSKTDVWIGVMSKQQHNFILKYDLNATGAL